MPTWILELHAEEPVAHAIGVLALVCVGGLALGRIEVRGIRLGTAGVLFVGILTGSFSKPVSHDTLAFVKELGLILFIFTIGVQLGPGFFASLRRQGLRLNGLAAGVVLLGAVLAPTLGWLLGIDPAAVLGVLAGATTNTPSLGAAQQTLTTLPGVSADQAALPALAYAVSYPPAIVGILGSLLLLKSAFRIDPLREAEEFAAEQQRRGEAIERRTLIVTNPAIALGILLGTLPIPLPGLPHPVRLGLAGGPLIVAILVGRFGRIGRSIWNMPLNSNLAFREFGIALFFASVGLTAGPRFFTIVFSTAGATWLVAGIVITTLPILLVGALARLVWGTNFTVLCGLLAGSMTDPPALAFANGMSGSEAPTVAYATVYPLVTLLRILTAQSLALILFR